MEFRKMSRSDLEQIAVIHKKAFTKNHFSSHLSSGLLKEFYENLLIRNEYCYVAHKEKEIAGFIISGTSTSLAVKEFSKKNFLKILLILLKHPLFLIQKIKQLSNRNPFVSRSTLRLLSIAVNPEVKVKGIGSFMIGSFDQEMVKCKERLYGLSVKKDNHKAIEFYLRNGFVEEKKTGNSIYYLKNL